MPCKRELECVAFGCSEPKTATQRSIRIPPAVDDDICVQTKTRRKNALLVVILKKK